VAGLIATKSRAVYGSVMTVQLTPDLEAMIQENLGRGPYQTVDEFVAEAVQLLHAREEWLAENRAEIEAKIEEGYAEARRGELIDAEQVHANLEERKRVWLAERRSR